MAMFDTLTYARKLREAGFTEQQAEAQAEALLAVIDANLATKQDIEQLRATIAQLQAATKRDSEELRAVTKRDSEELRTATEHQIELVRRDIKELESRIVLRLGSLIVVAVGGLAVLIKIR